MNTALLNQAKGKQREARIEAGFFDGRFRQRTIVDKKKKANKNACRNFKF